MKKILGLDLGIASIGWAYIKEDEGTSEIIGMGTRIVPLDVAEKDEFKSGNKISKNQQRTLRRTLRKGYDRYQLRKKYLREELAKNSMLPDAEHFTLPALKLYELRERAVQEKIELKEFGRILLHLNQKRGYKSSKKEQSADDKITDYEKTINDRHEAIRQKDITIGQYFYQELQKDERFRIKELVFPRFSYIEEFDRVCVEQQKHYPDILTDELFRKFKNEIIYYQRPLKSQKGLVSVCEFEGMYLKNKEGKEVFAGPKVAPRSSPLFQVCKIWESINNITIKNRRGEEFPITLEKKHEIFTYLDNNEKLSQVELFRILEIGKNDGYYANILIKKKGLQGNLTKAEINKALDGYENAEKLCSFNLTAEEMEPSVDTETGEIVTRKKIKTDFESQTLYKLWHFIYSIPEENDIINKLKKEFDLPEDKAQALAKIDFTKGGFGNKSARAIRKLLPYLQEGFQYSVACTFAGYNHSDSITKAENEVRKLADKLKLLPKNSLRQPVVEKILNQLINLVNALLENPKYGRPDEIRVELARELKQSREERNQTFSRIYETEKYHESIRQKLLEHPEFTKKKITRRDLERYKLWEEFGQCSPYEPGKIIGIGKLFNGEYDIEHIIPKSRVFDDSFSNKTICPRRLNSGEFAKNQMTAYDFMEKQDEDKFNNFLSLIDTGYTKGFNGIKISKAKRDKLLMVASKIPQDFIERQLNETRYISRKAKEILTQVCRNVWSTSGSVTNYLRHQWGWDDILVKLNWDKYPDEMKHKEDVDGRTRYTIQGWSKRDDNRHHAIDALAIACTTQGIIQRLSNLNQVVEAKQNQSQQSALKEYNEERLITYIEKAKPFTTQQIEDATANILVSFKAGKKVTTYGKRKIRRDGKAIVVQDKIITPRGPLSEESVYGKISVHGKEHYVIKFKLGAGQGFLFSGKETIKTSKKGKEKNQIQEVLDSIVDKGVRGAIRKRLESCGNNPKEAFKDMGLNPVWMNEEKRIPIKTVRCFTGLSAVEPITVKDEVNNINYFKYVKPGNNHHIAIYTDEKGEKHEHAVTFWDAVVQKKNGFPVIITKPKEIWDKILQNKNDYTDEFLSKLPKDKWIFDVSMQQNEMFVFNLTKEKLTEVISKKEYGSISNNIYRLQKVATNNYYFRHHLETKVDNKINGVKNEMLFKQTRRIILIQSLDSYFKINPIKVMVNNLGEVIKIQE